MKLYATVTSERASKGQGGNDYLDIVFQCGSSKEPSIIGSILLKNEGGTWILKHAKGNGEDWKIIDQGEIKGEKQKGETLHDDRDYNINPCRCGQLDCPSNQ